MMKLISICILALTAFRVVAAPEEESAVVPGKPTMGTVMDYGPFFSSSLLGPGTKGPLLAGRAITVRVSKDVFVAYDTETMRIAAAWTGPWLDLSKTHMVGPKGSVAPAVAGKILFSTKNGPGWSHEGSLDDPRKDALAPKVGPLPREWAQYKGLYLHGDQVILSYAVGKARVLESPGVINLNGAVAILRTFRIDRSEQALMMVIADDSPAVSAQLMGGPSAAKISNSGGAIRLSLPALAEPAIFAVLVTADAAAFAGVKIPPPGDLSKLIAGGAAQWGTPVMTAGVLGKPQGPAADGFPYVVDTLTLPFENPFNSWMRTTAHDLFADGKSAAVCTWNGDVWIVSGIDEKLEKLSWRRFATGMYEPLGLKIRDGKIYVLGRDQITRLHDLNGDGEADFYENFNNDGVCSPQYHHFKMDLDCDPAGNFYYASAGAWNTAEDFASHNCIARVSADGSKIDYIARGLRAANGIGVGPKGEVVTGDNQGHWMPSSKINYIAPGKTGGFYGFPYDPRIYEVKDAKEKEIRQRELSALYPAGIPSSFEPPLCWIPYAYDTSSGGQAFVPDDRWGPFKGHIVHTSYGKSSLFMVMHELVDVGDGKVIAQGGVWRFPLAFEAGIMRARFSAGDGQLYVSGMRGWQTNSAKEGCLQRVRFTGQPARLPVEIKATKQGIYLTYTCALDPATANDAGSYDIEQWNLKWSSAYGSPEFSVENPTKKGHDTVEIKSAKLQPDGRTVFLEMPAIRPVMQMSITFKLKSADGHNMEGAVYNTINVLK